MRAASGCCRPGSGQLGRGQASLKGVKVLLCVDGLLGSRRRASCDITVSGQEAGKEFVQPEPLHRNLSGKRQFRLGTFETHTLGRVSRVCSPLLLSFSS